MTIASLGWLALSSLVAGGGDPEREQRVAWLADHAFPLDTVEAGNGFSDLAPLAEIVGDARIVSLGESTHGSREIFQMKHRLVEYLASELGFTIFAIEASMPESYRVGDYVRSGEGDPHELIEGMYFWTWHTQEVLDMVRWMRAWNAPTSDRLAFTGFDMQTPDVAMELVLDFVARADPEFAEEARELYAGLASAYGGGNEFGVSTGVFPVELARGKRLRFSGDIKTELAQGFAGLWCRVDGPDRTMLAFDNMEDRGPRGTRDWERYALEVFVPEEAVGIYFGMIMPGRGLAWFDTLAVELDGEPYEDPELFDFGFEGRTIEGFSAFVSSYRIALDATCSSSGSQSLGMAYRRSASEMTADVAVRRALDVLSHLEASRERYVEDLAPREVEWSIQNARVVVQCLRSRANDPVYTRDRSMADNVAWILEQDPEACVVLWAHNGHVNRRPGALGGFLDERFGADHVVLGFATARGRYWAVNRDGSGQGEHALAEPPSDAFESLLDELDEPRLVVDLRTAEPGDPASQWLCEPLPFRSIGALESEQQFHPASLPREYDALVFLRDTTPAVQLAWKRKR